MSNRPLGLPALTASNIASASVPPVDTYGRSALVSNGRERLESAAWPVQSRPTYFFDIVRLAYYSRQRCRVRQSVYLSRHTGDVPGYRVTLFQLVVGRAQDSVAEWWHAAGPAAGPHSSIGSRFDARFISLTECCRDIESGASCVAGDVSRPQAERPDLAGMQPVGSLGQPGAVGALAPGNGTLITVDRRRSPRWNFFPDRPGTVAPLFCVDSEIAKLFPRAGAMARQKLIYEYRRCNYFCSFRYVFPSVESDPLRGKISKRGQN